MTRRVDRDELADRLTAALAARLGLVIARYMPYPEPRRVSLERLLEIMREVAGGVARAVVDEAWQAAAAAGPREPGMTLDEATTAAREAAEREADRALATALGWEARYEREAAPAGHPGDMAAGRDVQAELDALLAEREAAERERREARAAEAQARRAEKDAERREAARARAAREQGRRESRKQARHARGDAKARARGASGDVPARVRGAYLELGLAAGADRTTVELAFRARLHEVHPDKHAFAGTEALTQAHKRTIAAQTARAVILKWLDGRDRR